MGVIAAAKFALKSILWLIVALWVLLIINDGPAEYTVSIAASYGAAQTVGQTPKEPISREVFLRTEWGFYSESIPVGFPPGGFPITFREDGSIEPFNLSLITRWSLTDGILELSADPRFGAGPIRFEWREPGVFLSCSGLMLIAPKTTFAKSGRQPGSAAGQVQLNFRPTTVSRAL